MIHYCTHYRPAGGALAALIYFSKNQHTDEEKDRAAWAFISLSMMEYRSGAYGKAEEYCRQCLACPVPNAAREATARVILGMTCHQLGRVSDATALLATANPGGDRG